VDDELDTVPDPLRRDAARREEPCGQAPTLLGQAEEEVLGADVGVVELRRGRFGQLQRPAGARREAVELLAGDPVRGKKSVCRRWPAAGRRAGAS
jgi:hypothetical protein